MLGENKLKKRVMHVSAGGLNPGGVGSVIFSIVKSLYKEFDFYCIVFSRESDQEKEFEKYGKIHRINCYPRKGKRDYLELITRPLKLYFGIRKICKSEKIDVIHCHNQRDEWICLLAAKHAKVPVRIAHSHVTSSPKKISALEKVYKSISPAMLRRVATKKVGCSKLACEQLYRDNNFEVVPNSINIEKFSSKNRIEHDEINFIHVGRFNYAKNQEFVLETFAELCKRMKNIHLYLVGYGEEKDTERLVNLIDGLNIKRYAEIVPGDKVDVLEYYAKSDYMIFPARFEGFGIVLLEAQAFDIKCYVSENIQPEVDLGLLKFLELSQGARVWADYIVQDIITGCKKKCNYEKLLNYSNENISKSYKDLYSKRN